MWPTTLATTALATALEAVFGYPRPLLARIRHPIIWLGTLIAALDRSLNQNTHPPALRQAYGILTVVLLLAAAILPATLLQILLLRLSPWLGFPLLAVVMSPFLAQRSLHDHVAAVGQGMQQGGLPEARIAVAQIVGRDPQTLDEAGVMRAAIESLAENFSDGVTAPIFWSAAGGLPGLVAYKAINTADSMLGHRSKRHENFGWAAARLDDLINLPAARLAALWLILAAAIHPGASARDAWSAVLRDARNHRSPNAGWPESAMAGALGLRLAGPRVYGDVRIEDAWMGHGRSEATVTDLGRALSLYRIACLIQLAALATLAFVAWR